MINRTWNDIYFFILSNFSLPLCSSPSILVIIYSLLVQKMKKGEFILFKTESKFTMIGTN